MKIALIPFDIAWESREKNLQVIDEAIAACHSPVDLWILPEMFSSGFSMSPEHFATAMDGPVVTWMQDKARHTQTAVAGTVAIIEAGHYFNRFVFARPDGSMEWYDKKHLFSYAGEDRYYTAGKERVIVEYLGWRILLQTCYDLRFPVFSRNRNDFDLILYPANWPDTRAAHWSALLPARAIENQACVAAVNRIGNDGNGLRYQGDSMMVNFDGQILLHTGDAQGAFTGDFDLEALRHYRQKFPFLDDADDFELKGTDT